MAKRHQQSLLFTLENMVDESIAYLRKYEPVRGYFLAFSGGKDSIVTKRLCDMAGVKYRDFFSMTTIDPPELLQHIKRFHPDTEWFRPGKSFYKLLIEKFPPTRNKRWCCDYLKEKPGLETKKYFPIHVTGIRAEESSSRARRPQIDKHHKIPTTMNIKPIFHWNEFHVWSFVEQQKLDYPSLYDEGFDRIGCVICPFMCHKNQTKMEKHQQRWPGIYRAFENAIREWWEERGEKDGIHQSADEYIQGWYRGFE